MSVAFSGPIVKGGKGREYSELKEMASAGSLQFDGLGDELPCSLSQLPSAPFTVTCVYSLEASLHVGSAGIAAFWGGSSGVLLVQSQGALCEDLKVLTQFLMPHVVFVALTGELNCCPMQRAVFPFHPKALQMLVRGKVFPPLLESCVCSYTLNTQFKETFTS